MTRRSFLKRAFVAVACIALGAELLSDKCTAEIPENTLLINPDWAKASQEMAVSGIYGQHFYHIERAYQPLNPNDLVAILYK